MVSLGRSLTHCTPHREVFRETSDGVPAHVMGIVHGAVSYLPELVQYLAAMHPDLTVKAGELSGVAMATGVEVTSPPPCRPPAQV